MLDLPAVSIEGMVFVLLFERLTDARTEPGGRRRRRGGYAHAFTNRSCLAQSCVSLLGQLPGNR